MWLRLSLMHAWKYMDTSYSFLYFNSPVLLPILSLQENMEVRIICHLAAKLLIPSYSYMHSGMILLYLAALFFTPEVFLSENIITFCTIYVYLLNAVILQNPQVSPSITSRWRLTSAIGNFIYSFVHSYRIAMLFVVTILHITALFLYNSYFCYYVYTTHVHATSYCSCII